MSHIIVITKKYFFQDNKLDNAFQKPSKQKEEAYIKKSWKAIQAMWAELSKIG